MTDQPTDPSVDAAVDVAALLHGVPMRPEWRPAVGASFEMLRAAAALVGAFSLPDEAETAPVFRA